MKKILAAIALASSLALASHASAASVSIAPFGIGDDGKTVYALTLKGDIDKGDDRKVAAALGTALVERRFPGFIELRSPGGHADASLGISAILQRYGLPVLVSVSRKGFLRKLTNRPVEQAGAATLAAELFAEAQGADYIRTHAPGALRDGVKVLKAIGKNRG